MVPGLSFFSFLQNWESTGTEKEGFGDPTSSADGDTPPRSLTIADPCLVTGQSFSLHVGNEPRLDVVWLSLPMGMSCCHKRQRPPTRFHR